MQSLPKILVVEDDLRVADLLQRELQEAMFEVIIAYNAKDAKKIALSEPVELMISDLLLPDQNGTELCKNVKLHKPDLPILMLTALGNTDEKLKGFDAGADDYLVKPFEMKELIARIHAILKRYQIISPGKQTLLKCADLVYDALNKEVQRGSIKISLTPKESNLLEYFLMHPRKVISKKELAEKVWQTNFDTGTNFVDVYINYLRKKIDKNFSIKLLHTKPGIGYVLKCDSNEN
ncbi:MAG: response regulator transcription factor [Flavobacterium sp.]